jgi:hypothetical protein
MILKGVLLKSIASSADCRERAVCARSGVSLRKFEALDIVGDSYIKVEHNQANESTALL